LLLDQPFLHHRRAPGNTCLAALHAEVPGTPKTPINVSQGCGGVMRVGPVGLTDADDPFDLASNAAALTHGHPSGWLAAGALGQVIFDLQRRPS
jgi:ADP-ribosyl-[dinitrogen reductase] hydrolase